jgi:putative hydrolases of HD superfamily
MEEIHKLRKIYALKDVARDAQVGNRKESSAEHTWSTLMLADYFLSKTKEKINRLKVYELLMYHDVVEIEAGDTAVHHEEKRKNKKILEEKAAKKLSQSFPPEIKEKFAKLFLEFEQQETREAQFAKAMDAMDALVHELDYKIRWKGWDIEMVRKYHGSYTEGFPEVKKVFDKMMKYCDKEGYFSQG